MKLAFKRYSTHLDFHLSVLKLWDMVILIYVNLKVERRRFKFLKKLEIRLSFIVESF